MLKLLEKGGWLGVCVGALVVIGGLLAIDDWRSRTASPESRVVEATRVVIATGTRQPIPPRSPAPVTAVPTSTPTITYIGDVDFIDSIRGLAVRTGNKPGLAMTVDGGQTWSKVDVPIARPEVVEFVDLNHGWLAGSTDEGCGSTPPCRSVAVTDDGGKTWSALSGVAGHVTDIMAISQADVWIKAEACPSSQCATSTAVIWATNDEGKTWRKLSISEPVEQLIRVQRVSDVAARVLTPTRLLRTSDDGASWSSSANPCEGDRDDLGDRTGAMSFADANNGWVLCLGQGAAGTAPGTLHHTTDGGVTWNVVALTPYTGRPLPPGVGYLPWTPHSIRFIDGNHGWLTDGHSGVIWRTDYAGYAWVGMQTNAIDDASIVFADAETVWLENRGALFHADSSGTTLQEIKSDDPRWP